MTTRKDMVAAAAPEDLDPIKTLHNMGLGTAAQMGSAWFEAMGEMSSEVMTFIAERIREDVKTQHEMLHCKDLTELQHIQAKFLQKAMDQYKAETGKLMEMSREAMQAVQNKN